MKLNKLTKEEERVIVHRGTERPFTGEYENNFSPGTYVCRRCDAPLYRSKDKFDAHCGWPAFDQEIKGAVKHVPPDPMHKMLGAADELECARCGAHLGHLYIGEGFTETNVRHCVNSISLKFIPDKGGKNER
jgi:methionine-R-sulfoxide reductase